MAYAKLDMRACEEQGLKDSYSLYLKEINRYQLLTAEEELVYSRLYKKKGTCQQGIH